MGALFLNIKAEIIDLYNFRLVTASVVSSTLKMRYKKSFVGIFWSLLGPALNYLIVGFVFSHLARNQNPNYFLFLFSGAVIYNLMASIINQSPGVMINNEHFIKKIYLPKSIFVLNQVLIELINFFFALAVLFLLGLVFNKITFSAAMLTLPYTLFMAVLFSCGICSILSITTVFFRDFIHLIPLGMQAIFFGTPVLYSIDALPIQFRPYIMLNPFYHFVECFRYPIYHLELPPEQSLIIVSILGPLSFFLGILVLKTFDNKIVFKL